MADTRTETRASYALQYNNGTPIPLKDFSGLLTTSQIEVSDTATVLKRQRIHSLEFHEVTLTLPLPLQEPALQLFDGVMKGSLSTVFTTIFRLDANSKLVQSYELGNCKIVQISFPALDAGSKDRGSATITLQPEHIDMTLGNNARISTASEKNTAAFITSNFRLNIDRVSTNRVSKISAITVCPHERENGDGKDTLDFIEFKTIQISIPESETDNEDWQKWLIEFVRNEQQEGRNGSLQLMGPDLKKVLLEISLTNIFIVSTLFHDPGAADQVAKSTIELLFDVATIINKTTPDDTKFIRSGGGLKLPDPKVPEIKIPYIKNIKPGR